MQSTESTSEALTHDPQRFSLIGLSTLDLDKTREFYERVLVADAITIQEGGRLRHLFFDVAWTPIDQVCGLKTSPAMTPAIGF